MVRLLGSIALVLAFTLVGSENARAEKMPVTVTKAFQGKVDDEKLGALAPANGVVVSQTKLDAIWEAWKIADKKPIVDFDKEFVIVRTTRGSRLKLTTTLDTETGDLVVGGVATTDITDGFRYSGGVVSRAGVKKIAGKEIPKE